MLSGNGGNGLRITNSNNTTVQANFMGVGANNATIVANGGDGLLVSGSSKNTQVGGVIPLGNVISGNNRNGIEVRDTASGLHLVQHLRRDLRLRGAAPNRRDGILITSSGGNNLIRTCIVSGNLGNGIELGGNATGVQVTDTAVGTNTAIQTAIPNGGSGILISGNAHNNAIGGFQPSIEPQVTISSNRGYGIEIVGSAHNNVMFHTYIGTNFNDTADLGNWLGGIFLGPGTSVQHDRRRVGRLAEPDPQQRRRWCHYPVVERQRGAGELNPQQCRGRCRGVRRPEQPDRLGGRRKYDRRKRPERPFHFRPRDGHARSGQHDQRQRGQRRDAQQCPLPDDRRQHPGIGQRDHREPGVRPLRLGGVLRYRGARERDRGEHQGERQPDRFAWYHVHSRVRYAVWSAPVEDLGSRLTKGSELTCDVAPRVKNALRRKDTLDQNSLEWPHQVDPNASMNQPIETILHTGRRGSFRVESTLASQVPWGQAMRPLHWRLSLIAVALGFGLITMSAWGSFGGLNVRARLDQRWATSQSLAAYHEAKTEWASVGCSQTHCTFSNRDGDVLTEEFKEYHLRLAAKYRAAVGRPRPAARIDGSGDVYPRAAHRAAAKAMTLLTVRFTSCRSFDH